MTLALFDLDNTLIAGDSDYAWGQFIVTKDMVNKETYAAANQQFYQDYVRGELDAVAYQQFAMAPLKGRTLKEMAALHAEFMCTYIEPIWLSKAVDLIGLHRQKGDRLVVVTATNRFVVEPIVQALGIDDLVCSETVVVDGRYTGELLDEPYMGQGKVSKLQRWMTANNESLQCATFYSDSHNDLPLLNMVPNPVAVDPDDRLRHTAEQQGWEIISLR